VAVVGAGVVCSVCGVKVRKRVRCIAGIAVRVRVVVGRRKSARNAARAAQTRQAEVKVCMRCLPEPECLNVVRQFTRPNAFRECRSKRPHHVGSSRQPYARGGMERDMSVPVPGICTAREIQRTMRARLPS